MDERAIEGRKLIDDIRGRAIGFIDREGRAPNRVSLCQMDLMKVWIALGDEEYGFKPDPGIEIITGRYFADDLTGMTSKIWLWFNVVNEIPEGVVVVS